LSREAQETRTEKSLEGQMKRIRSKREKIQNRFHEMR